MSSKSVTPATVRAWATTAGLTTGTRGKFSAEVIKAYNKANPKARYSQGKFVRTTTVVVKRQGATPIRTNVNQGEARKALVAAGLPVNARGRLTTAQVEQFVLLGR